MTNEGKTVLQNIKKEENVPDTVTNNFFQELSKTYKVGMDPLNHMEKVLSKLTKTALSGPDADVGSMDLLIRFSRMARLLEQPIFKKAGIGYSRLMKNPGLISILIELSLGNARGIVWAALQNPVTSDMAGGTSIEEILSNLGLTDKFIEPWYQAVYTVSDIGASCLVPTVLDAGSDYRFRPPAKDAPYGMTSPFSGGGSGYPEYVHQKCVIDKPGITLHNI